MFEKAAIRSEVVSASVIVSWRDPDLDRDETSIASNDMSSRERPVWQSSHASAKIHLPPLIFSAVDTLNPGDPVYQLPA